jgi:AcrR family transcriptional regulator
MYKNCITQPAKQRQRELENELLQVMLHQDYESISVSDLCDTLGIPRKSFYRYFSNKDGALYALVDHALLDFAKEFFQPGTELNLSLAEDFFRYWLKHRDILHALERNNLGGVLVQRTIELTVEDNTFIPQVLPSDILYMQNYVLLFLISGVMSLLIQWKKDNFKATPREMAITTVHMLNRSIYSK